MDKITISKEEYEELLNYKQAFIDQCNLLRKKGKTYEKYKEFQDKDSYFSSRYKDMYKIMNEQYAEDHKLFTAR